MMQIAWGCTVGSVQGAGMVPYTGPPVATRHHGIGSAWWIMAQGRPMSDRQTCVKILPPHIRRMQRVKIVERLGYH